MSTKPHKGVLINVSKKRSRPLYTQPYLVHICTEFLTLLLIEARKRLYYSEYGAFALVRFMSILMKSAVFLARFFPIQKA